MLISLKSNVFHEFVLGFILKQIWMAITLNTATKSAASTLTKLKYEGPNIEVSFLKGEVEILKTEFSHRNRF